MNIVKKILNQKKSIPDFSFQEEQILDLKNDWLRHNCDMVISKLYDEYRAKIYSKESLVPSDYSIVSFALDNNASLNLNLSPEYFDQLFVHCVPPDKKWSSEVLAALAVNNKREKNNLRQDQIDNLVDNTDINKHISGTYMPVLALVFKGNKEQNLNLTATQIASLIENTDFQAEHYFSGNSINSALVQNKINGLDLTPGQWDYLLENAKLSASMKEKEVPHHCVLSMFASIGFEECDLNVAQMDYIFKSSGLDIEEIEKKLYPEDKKNYINQSLGIEKSSYSIYYSNIILSGYETFKIDKLRRLAIEKEKQMLSHMIQNAPAKELVSKEKMKI